MSEAMMPLCLVSMDWEFLKKKQEKFNTVCTTSAGASSSKVS